MAKENAKNSSAIAPKGAYAQTPGIRGSIQALMESLPWGVLELDLDGCILFASSKIIRFLGYTPSELAHSGEKQLTGCSLKDILLSGHVEAHVQNETILQSQEPIFIPEVFLAHSASHEEVSALHVLPQWLDGIKTGTVILCLAAVEYPEQAEQNSDEPTQATLDGLQVLLVEDDDINQQIGQELLESVGVVVTLAANGKEAIQAVSTQPFSLVLMDIQMPVMGGLEATRIIRSAGFQLPIIAMTGNSSQKDIDESLQAGMNGHITKPIDPQGLYTALLRWAEPGSVVSLPASTRQTQSSAVEQANTQLGLLEGINVKSGLANVVGNEKLYIDLLRRFAEKYRHSGESLAFHSKQKNTEEASRLAHTVKGLAANLGALHLAEIVKRIEHSIDQADQLEPLLVEYETELQLVTRSIDRLTQALEPKRPETLVALDPATCESFKNFLYLLPQLMETDWGTAENELNQFAAPLLGSSFAHSFDKLRQALEDFDLESVRKECETFLRSI